jgi:hypothetical protein
MRGAVVFCILYVSVALLHRSNEVFPAFGWSLVSTVPEPVSRDYSARIYGIDGASKPVWFENADLVPQAQEVQGYTLLQRLGRSLASDEPVAADLERKQFESSYLGSLPKARYEIVERTYDIRKRVDCQNCFLTDKVLGSYTNS